MTGVPRRIVVDAPILAGAIAIRRILRRNSRSVYFGLSVIEAALWLTSSISLVTWTANAPVAVLDAYVHLGVGKRSPIDAAQPAQWPNARRFFVQRTLGRGRDSDHTPVAR